MGRAEYGGIASGIRPDVESGFPARRKKPGTRQTTAALESAARMAMSGNSGGATWFVFTAANFARIVSRKRFKAIANVSANVLADGAPVAEIKFVQSGS